MVDQLVRYRADFFPKFNGTAGIWRKRAIEDAGGWTQDTVTEDLCLSIRAVLGGWKFRYLPHIVTPGELPTSITAYKNQQARWAKGSIQCVLKFWWDILTAQNQTLSARLFALVSMSAYISHPITLFIILFQFPLIIVDYQMPEFLSWLSFLGYSQPVLFVMAQLLLYPNWLHKLRHFPTLILISMAMSPSITRAIFQIPFSKTHFFIRTPKGEQTATRKRRFAFPASWDGYRMPLDSIVYVEIGLILYTAAGVAFALMQNNTGPLFLLGSACIGYIYVSYLTFTE